MTADGGNIVSRLFSLFKRCLTVFLHFFNGFALVSECSSDYALFLSKLYSLFVWSSKYLLEGFFLDSSCSYCFAKELL